MYFRQSPMPWLPHGWTTAMLFTWGCLGRALGSFNWSRMQHVHNSECSEICPCYIIVVLYLLTVPSQVQFKGFKALHGTGQLICKTVFWQWYLPIPPNLMDEQKSAMSFGMTLRESVEVAALQNRLSLEI